MDDLTEAEEDLIQETLPDLMDIISLEGFNFENWPEDEVRVLTPRLQHAGYTGIIFSDGERDELGVVTRIVTCTDIQDGIERKFTIN